MIYDTEEERSPHPFAACVETCLRRDKASFLLLRTSISATSCFAEANSSWMLLSLVLGVREE